MADPPAREKERTPWRVEGHPDSGKQGGQEQPRPPMIPPAWRRYWWVPLALLALNFFLTQSLAPKTERLTVPYTLFYDQVQAGNVKEISSKGSEIQGEFKKAVTYPPTGKDSKTNTKFQTFRPALGDDGLAKLLIAQNVTVNAHKVDTGSPVWQTIIFGFGPTLLLVALVRRARKTQLRRRRPGRLRALRRTPLRALLAAHDVRRRRGHRRGRGGARSRSSTSCANPGPLPAARRA